jgi:hypothetical protein
VAGVSLAVFCISLLFMASSITSYLNQEKGKRKIGARFAVSLFLTALSFSALVISVDAKIKASRIEKTQAPAKQVEPDKTNLIQK